MKPALTLELAQEIARRSAAGEGIVPILKSLGIPPLEGLRWLKAEHADLIIGAKRKQKEAA